MIDSGRSSGGGSRLDNVRGTTPSTSLPGQSSLLVSTGAESPSAELAHRVRLLAGSRSPDAVRGALEIELARLREAYETDPRGWSSWADGVDVLGSAFEDVLPGAARRAAGQFLTPYWAADLMAGWLLQEETELLCDPAVGSGRLLYRAAQRREHSPQGMVGFDIDPGCLTMADLNLRMRDIQGYRLQKRNFLLDPVHVAPDAVICNPPYCRHHAIEAAEKARIHDGFGERLGLRLSRLAGLHVLFLIRALEVAAPGARLAFITPAEWLDVNYGRQIKQFVLDHAHIEGLVILKDDQLFFDGALTTAAITLLRKRHRAPEADPITHVVQLPDELPDVEAVLAALRGEGDLPVEAIRLSHTHRWSRRTSTRWTGRPLRELARVRRGIATGCNQFFVVSETERRRHGLETSTLRPCVTSPRLIDGLEFDAERLSGLDDATPRWVLECHDPSAERADGPLGCYLRWGREELRANAGYLASKRTPWYGLERRGASPILFTYMNRQRPRFIRNRAGAVPLNTFLIVEPHDGIDADRLWAALNSHEFLEQLQEERRAYGGGLWKIEPKELEALRLEGFGEPER